MLLDSGWYAIVRRRLESSLINASNNFELQALISCGQAWSFKSTKLPSVSVSEKYLRRICSTIL